ncbi:MAG: SDR family NAD(P)-dependent oxidoreductase [Pseudomonadota bacterium]
MTPLADLNGKVVIITGATKGMGRSTAVLFAQSGAKVVATGRSEADGAETERQIKEAGGDGVFIRQDVCEEADWARVTEEAMSRYGGLDIVVNNAGVFMVKPIAETSEEDYDWIYRTNVEGSFLGLKYGFEAIRKTGRGGSIVNVSSLMGQVGYPGATAYCATKGAITGLTKSAALEGAELEPQIRVNSLHPGVIWTEMLTSQFGDDQSLQDAFAEDTPLKMIGLPEYMADAIAYLASDQSSYVTGTELTVDGGRGAD